MAGSNKPRLQYYAKLIDDLCIKFNIDIHACWIPRDLNIVADTYSKMFDPDSYSIHDDCYRNICLDFKVKPDLDVMASIHNTKCPRFFSLTACPNTLGIDVFRFYWGKPNICWIFPPVPLISKSINHLRLCSGTGLLIVPQWKNYSFYPMLTEIDNKFVKGVKVYNGAALLKKGDDDSSCFGPHFRGNIEIWYLKF
jgi:hypothetical protein